MRLVDLTLPQGTFLNPHFPADAAECPAVVGGNVETSQRLADTLLRALDLAACSQGTMNNVLFGDDRPRAERASGSGWGYCETGCGGGGAGPGFDGASAVHSHMTNTRITDPEVLEQRFPVRLVRFAVRRGSGGVGKHSGGDGVIREIELLEPMTVSFLGERRSTAPFGIAGG